MASINKRGKKWLVEVRRQGYYKSKRFETRLEAESWAVEQEQRLLKPGSVKNITLLDALQRYAEEISPTKKGARWEQIRLKKIARSFLSDLPLFELTTDDLQ